MIRVLTAALAFVVLVPQPAGRVTTELVFPFAETLTTLTPVDTAPATWTDPELLPPTSDLPIEEWYDCRPPRVDTVCVDGFEPDEVVAAVLRSEPRNAEGWRPIVEIYFEPGHVDRALRVIRCESNGDPWAKNPGSTASGLFQHLASQWDTRAERAGWGHADVFDPEANIAVAAWLVYEGGGWGHWNPSRHCWA